VRRLFESVGAGRELEMHLVFNLQSGATKGKFWNLGAAVVHQALAI